MTSVPVFAHYRPEAETKIETDASEGVIGGVLFQKTGEYWHPVAFLLNMMIEVERKYEIHDYELLVIIHALKEWSLELTGLQRKEPFKVYTDYRALQWFRTKQSLNHCQI